MKLTLHIWRQKSPNHVGRLVKYEHTKVNPHMSFLEMLDVLNEELVAKGEEPIAFDHDCREGICGSCGFMVNGVAHGPQPATTICQLHRSEEHTSELQSPYDLVCRLLLEKKKLQILTDI